MYINFVFENNLGEDESKNLVYEPSLVIQS